MDYLYPNNELESGDFDVLLAINEKRHALSFSQFTRARVLYRMKYLAYDWNTESYILTELGRGFIAGYQFAIEGKNNG